MHLYNHGVKMKKIVSDNVAIAAGRSTYRHGDLRRALLDAAVQLAREGGPQAVVLREATRRAGVVPNAAYRHFANHQALFDAVRTYALARMAALMEETIARAVGDVHDAAQRARAMLRAVGAAYLQFAREETGLFLTAFSGRSFHRLDTRPANAQDVAGRDPFRLLSSALDALVQAGILPAHERPDAEFLAWSTVHGMAFLLIDGPLIGASETHYHALAQRLLQMVERGLTMAPASAAA